MNTKKVIKKVLNENKIDPSNFDEVIKVFKTIKLPPNFELISNDPTDKEIETIYIAFRISNFPHVICSWNDERKKVLLTVSTTMFNGGKNFNIPSKKISIDANFKSNIEKLLFGIYEISKFDLNKMQDDLYNSI